MSLEGYVTLLQWGAYAAFVSAIGVVVLGVKVGRLERKINAIGRRVYRKDNT